MFMCHTATNHRICAIPLAIALTFTTLGLGCAGEIGDAVGPGAASDMRDLPGGSGAAGARPSSTPTGSAPAGVVSTSGAPPVDVMMGDMAACTNGGDPGPSFSRRLNRFEYDNTVRDLLGETTHPASTFPADEKRFGFDNNAEALTVSPLLAEQYFVTAERLAEGYVERTAPTLPTAFACNTSTPAGEDACATAFIAGFGKRAFRRPLLADETQILSDIYTTGKKSSGFKTGLRLVVATALQLPGFLYRIELGTTPAAGQKRVRVDGWDMASRLSYLIWGTMPDAALFTAAEQGKLGTPQEIGAQAQRMLADPKARAMVARFQRAWLELDGLAETEKDIKVFPKYSSTVAGSMAQETDRFLDHVFWDGAGTLSGVLTAPYTFVDSTLAKYYGVTYPATDAAGKTATGFQRIDTDARKRGGLLTQGALLSMLAHANQTSPVLRGKFVRERLLCHHLPPPPPDVMTDPPKLDATATTRERLSALTKEDRCAACHAMMNPIGFGFENFDAAGAWRDTENGKPIDATGEVIGVAWDGTFDGVGALAKKLAASPEASSCMARNWFRYGYGREEGDVDRCSLGILQRRFAGGGGKLRDLVAALVETDAFLYRRAVAP